MIAGALVLGQFYMMGIHGQTCQMTRTCAAIERELSLNLVLLRVIDSIREMRGPRLSVEFEFEILAIPMMTLINSRVLN